MKEGELADRMRGTVKEEENKEGSREKGGKENKEEMADRRIGMADRVEE